MTVNRLQSTSESSDYMERDTLFYSLTHLLTYLNVEKMLVKIGMAVESVVEQFDIFCHSNRCAGNLV